MTANDAANHRKERIEFARETARRLLQRYGADAPEHIAIERFCAALGIRLQVTQLDGCDAYFARSLSGKASIILSDRIIDPAARRFNIAHELGHFLLGHPMRIPSWIPGPQEQRVSLNEAEANAFAAELLMPERLVRAHCDFSRADLEGPKKIAANYNVSILASAIRFTELASEPCAAVFSVAARPGLGRVKWAVGSESFARRIPRGRMLSPESLASVFYETGTLDIARGSVPHIAWFDKPANGDLIEHAISSTELRTVLSMLWLRRVS